MPHLICHTQTFQLCLFQQKKPARAPTDPESTAEMATKSLLRTGTSVIGRLVSTQLLFQPPNLTHRKILSNGEGFNISLQLFPSLFKLQSPPEDDVSVPKTPSSWFLYPSGLPSLRFFLPDGDSSNEPLICFPKRTFQPSTIKRKRTHGYFSRKATKGGRKVIARRIAKGRSRITA